ncbi:MAG: ParB N-terminal domain-containing protein [Spirochaetes bacterium]|nr:ParB N-terminal domain-containing protein [Spirochaetota bacterium]
MEDIFSRIKIVPLKDVLVHELTVKKWSRNLAVFIEQSGIQKNPIIVHRIKGRYIVLDGMHRVEALKLLKCRDILVYLVDYFDPKIELHNWYSIVMGAIKPHEVLEKIKGKGLFQIKKESPRLDVGRLIKERKIFSALRDKKNNIFTVSLRRGMKIQPERYLTIATSLIERVEDIVDNLDYRILYVPDTTGERDFKTSTGSILIYRPLFKKDEVIKRPFEGKVFPRKSTRHIIPGRPLGVNINIPLLKEKINLKTKNKLLHAHLMWCFESNRMRFYPEPVYIFSD